MKGGILFCEPDILLKLLIGCNIQICLLRMGGCLLAQDNGGH